MNLPRMLPFRLLSFVLAVFALFAPGAYAAEPGTISGVVRDAGGKAIEGATVTLTADQTPVITIQTKSDKEGRFQFTDVPPGNYSLSVEMAGFVAAKQVTATLSSDIRAASLDFTLTRIAPDAQTKDSTEQPARPKFESAGVRGLVDPGGYSAPANAAAATGLIQGMADVKRAGNEHAGSAANAMPCGVEPELKKAVDATPRSAEANRRLGEFYLTHGQSTLAIPFLKQAAQFDEKDTAAVKELAEGLLQTEQFGEALSLLTTLSQKSDQPEIHQLLARANEGLGKFKQASLEYQIAAKSSPTEENLFGVGYEMILAGLPADAEQAFVSSAKVYPRSVTLLIGAGIAQFLQGKTSEALRSILRAADLDPADPRPYPFLANAAGASGVDGESVRASFKRFLDLAPDDAQASYFYALSLWDTRAQNSDPSVLSTIETLLKRAIQLDPILAKAHFQLAVLYFERSDFLGAVREFETTLRLAPDMKDVHYRLASAFQHIGQMQQASNEMRLFQESRETAVGQSAGAGISIEQFVSVIAPKAHSNELQRACVEGKP